MRGQGAEALQTLTTRTAHLRESARPSRSAADATRHAPRRTRRRGWRRTRPLPLPGAGGGACPAASTASALLRGSPTSTCGGRRQAAAAGARGLPPAGPVLGAIAEDSPCESGALGRPSAPCDGRTPSRRRRGLSVSAAARQAPPAGCRGLSSASRGLQVRSRPPTSFILPGIDSNMILKEFGDYYFESYKRSDSDHILMTLAWNFYNFMKNSSALHSYLSLLYQPRNDII